MNSSRVRLKDVKTSHDKCRRIAIVVLGKAPSSSPVLYDDILGKHMVPKIDRGATRIDARAFVRVMSRRSTTLAHEHRESAVRMLTSVPDLVSATGTLSLPSGNASCRLRSRWTQIHHGFARPGAGSGYAAARVTSADDDIADATRGSKGTPNPLVKPRKS